MNIIAQAETNAVCCPQCGSAKDVTWQGREGTTSGSKDIWSCSTDGKTFKTTAS